MGRVGVHTVMNRVCACVCICVCMQLTRAYVCAYGTRRCRWWWAAGTGRCSGGPCRTARRRATGGARGCRCVWCRRCRRRIRAPSMLSHGWNLKSARACGGLFSMGRTAIDPLPLPDWQSRLPMMAICTRGRLFSLFQLSLTASMCSDVKRHATQGKDSNQGVGSGDKDYQFLKNLRTDP